MRLSNTVEYLTMISAARESQQHVDIQSRLSAACLRSRLRATPFHERSIDRSTSLDSREYSLVPGAIDISLSSPAAGDSAEDGEGGRCHGSPRLGVGVCRLCARTCLNRRFRRLPGPAYAEGETRIRFRYVYGDARGGAAQRRGRLPPRTDWKTNLPVTPLFRFLTCSRRYSRRYVSYVIITRG